MQMAQYQYNIEDQEKSDLLLTNKSFKLKFKKKSAILLTYQKECVHVKFAKYFTTMQLSRKFDQETSFINFQ